MECAYIENIFFYVRRISYMLHGIEVNRIIRCLSEACIPWTLIENIDIFARMLHGFRLTFKNRTSYINRTGVPLPTKCCILYIFSTNISSEYLKHAARSPFFSSKCRLFHNATFFGSCIIHILHTECAKI